MSEHCAPPPLVLFPASCKCQTPTPSILPLSYRTLPPGRGRVWKSNGDWFGDYRAANGTLYCAWDETPEVVIEWIYRKAARHAVR